MLKSILITFTNKDNEPRMKGAKVVYENKNTEITKGVFTACKTDKCPPR